jgi:hypothetical protein
MKGLKDCGFLPSYVIDSIPPRQRDFLAVRYGWNWSLNQGIYKPMTLQQVGEYFDLSKQQVQKICNQGIENLCKKKQKFHKDTLCRRIYLYAIASIDFSRFIREIIPLLQAEEKALVIPIEDLGLSRKPYNSLKRNQVDTIGDILGLLPDDLLRLPELGKKSATEIFQALANFEKSFFNTPCLRIYLYAIASIDFSQFIRETTPLLQAEEETLTIPIEDLGLSRKPYNSLKRNRVNTVGDVLALLPDDLLKLSELGQKSATEIVQALTDFEKSFFK